MTDMPGAGAPASDAPSAAPGGPPLKVAYLLNTYPVPSGTFIRGEIAALEALDVEVARFAVRRFAGPLVDPDDAREAGRTRYLLSGNAAGLLAAFAREIATNPQGLARALPAWWRLYRNAGGGLVRHAAYLLEASLLRQELARRRIRHVHAHFSTNAAAVAMLAHLLGGAPYSFTAHGPDEFVDGAGQSIGLKIAHAAFVVAISDFCRTTLAGFALTPQDTDRIRIARCGIALERFAPAPPVGAAAQMLVCVGRLCPQKGQVHIPAAVAMLRPRFPGLKVLLVGDGESRPAIEQEIARHGVGDAVILHGWAAGPEVRRLIADSRALLLPSYAEGLPMVIMEAFAMGRPVISTTIAGIPELVDASCGWLVPPGDVPALAAAMEAALTATPDQLAQMGRIGRARIEERHTLARLGARLRQLFAASLRPAPAATDAADARAAA